MEVVPGVHRIEVPLGERMLCLYLLIGRERILLVDTGCDRTPYQYLVPYLESVGRFARDIEYVLITHSDWDHQGGNVSLKEIAPRALLMCHPFDQLLIESIDRLIEKRYSEFQEEHAIDESTTVKGWIRQNNRSDVPIGLTLTGGETLRIDERWRVEVWHTPGHSRGHLSLYDARDRTAIIADAVLWNCVPTREGKPSFPPTYRYVKDYLSTIEMLNHAQIDTLLTGHYPVLRGPEIRDFLDESRNFADRLRSTLSRELKLAHRPRTTRQLVEAVGPRAGGWSAEAGMYLVFPLVGHLEELAESGHIEKLREEDVVKWSWKR